jgi:hypothetical protein
VTAAETTATAAINRRDCSAARGVLTNRVQHLAYLVQLQAHAVALRAPHVDDDAAARLFAHMVAAVHALEGTP